MREILFRGKRLDNGEWVEGLPYKAKYGGISAIVDNDEESFLVLPDSIGQFSGLCDKNGKRIFEGDIVKADDYIFSIKYGKCGGTPNADNYGYMGFYLEAVSEGTKLCAHYGLRDDMCYFTDIAVIGNIHDNPELMAAGADQKGGE